MRKEIVTLNESPVFIGGIDINSNTTLRALRNDLEKNGNTIVNVVYKGGKHTVEFVAAKLTRLQMINVGLIKGTKEERKQYKALTKDDFAKKNAFGYAW